MKRAFYILAIVLTFPSLVLAADEHRMLEGHTLYRLQVEGLVCHFCAYNVERRLQALSGVEYVDVDVESGRVLVGMQPDYELAEGHAKTLIENAGFRFEGTEIRPMTLEELQDPE